MRRLRGLVGGFLVTFVEREGRLGGTNMDLVPALLEAAGSARVTIAGGITSPAEIAQLDRLGADAQVGMALYTGAMDLADAIAAPLTSDRGDGLWPTVVADESGGALGLAYSSRESLRRAIAGRRGIYHSRKRGVWVKGESSGNTQELLRVDLDCDRDCLRFTVRQKGAGFCHSGASTCWGSALGFQGLERRLAQSVERAGSYTRRLVDDSVLLRAKLIEEAAELADAPTHADAALEAADLLYFAVVAMRRSGVTLAEVARELDRRALRVTRRPGNSKLAREAVR
jgi:phosphoribosyl-ATP pyrophosphohydrolase